MLTKIRALKFGALLLKMNPMGTAKIGKACIIPLKK